MSTLRGQTAVITGASGAIGGAIARQLSGHGAELLLCGRDRARLEALAREVEGEATRVEILVADLVEPERRGLAFGTYHAVIGITTLPASLLAGLLWQGFAGWSGFGPAAPFAFGAAAAAVA